MKEQINLRLPGPTASQSLATLLDPATKTFALKLLGKILYEETVPLLRNEHHKIVKAMKTKVFEGEGVAAMDVENVEAAEEEILEEPREMDSDDDVELSFVSVIKSKKDEKTLEAEVLIQSDTIVTDWLATDQVSNEFLFDKAERLTETIGATLKLEKIISSFDTMKYFRIKGHEDYPAITMLARIHFARLDNAGFQERVFSTATLVMSKSQSRVDFNREDSHLEMRTLLAHNKVLIRNGVI